MTKQLAILEGESVLLRWFTPFRTILNTPTFPPWSRPFGVSLQKTRSQVLVEKVEQGPVGLFVGGPDLFVLQIGPRRHEPVDLVLVPLDLLRDGQLRLVLGHLRLVLVHAGDHAHGDGHLGRVVGVHHGGVTRRGGLEDRVGSRDQVDNLEITGRVVSFCDLDFSGRLNFGAGEKGGKYSPYRPNNIQPHPNP